jgi:hypothetical protein
VTHARYGLAGPRRGLDRPRLRAGIHSARRGAAQGQPGCDLLATPDLVTFAVAAAGTVATEIAIPPTPAVIGASFWQQMHPFELDAALQIVAVTATDALRFTVGVP